jgi:hypothetical protein
VHLLAKGLPSRKSPLINRGTWARHAVVRQIIQDFAATCLEQHLNQTNHQQHPQQHASSDITCGSCSSLVMGPICQVVVWGAGSDSTWFNLQLQDWELLPAVRYIEVDHPEVNSTSAVLHQCTSRHPREKQRLTHGKVQQLLPLPSVTSMARFSSFCRCHLSQACPDVCCLLST